MPSEFRKEIDANWEIFQRENADAPTVMKMHIIPLSHMHDFIARGNAGETEARAVIGSLSRWITIARKAKGFGCISCHADLTFDEARGFVLLAPQEPGHQIGMAGAFCSRCHHAGPDVIEANVLRGIEQEGIGTVMRPQ
jgi:hypothetical protein